MIEIFSFFPAERRGRRAGLYLPGEVCYNKTKLRGRRGDGGMEAGVIELDLHGMTKVQALAAVDARLRRADGGVYRLRLIHGYHGGTELREAIRERYRRHPRVLRIELGLNQGQTDLVLREY